ncbi:URC4/urg3 family protein [soil metagenome]
MFEPEPVFADPSAVLRSTATIRERSKNIADAVGAGSSPHFTLDRSRMDSVAARVEYATRAAYPSLRIPYHSRWRHFESGGVDRKLHIEARLRGRSIAEHARARIDLTLVSVLLDAGAGHAWGYIETESGQRFSRSEGLGVASFRAVASGAFSSDPNDPIRVDGKSLQQMDADKLATLFQVDEFNPLVGLEGRAQLMRRLGDALLAAPDVFGRDGRPGGLYDSISVLGQRTQIDADEVLGALLLYLSPIWLTESRLDGVSLGDVWKHPAAGGDGASAGWVPFHKLSQWLTYSLLEPFEWAGIEVTGLDRLTGLPEYRNGGLFLDSGVIVPRDAALSERSLKTSDEVVVEWRALTVALIDELAPMVRRRLSLTEVQMPLACILEGGTWAAGRAIARELREGGNPPLQIESDGTVF